MNRTFYSITEDRIVETTYENSGYITVLAWEQNVENGTAVEIHSGYKIIEIKDGKPKFMFCGLNGSRVIDIGVWLTAENKLVKDGTSKTEYLSGFHVIDSLDHMKEYAKRFKNFENKYVVKVGYMNYRPKPTKNSLAILADKIYIPIEVLECNIPLEIFK